MAKHIANLIHGCAWEKNDSQKKSCHGSKRHDVKGDSFFILEWFKDKFRWYFPRIIVGFVWMISINRFKVGFDGFAGSG